MPLALNRRRRATALLILAVITALVVLTRNLIAGDLISRSTRVTATKCGLVTSCFWLSDRRALLIGSETEQSATEYFIVDGLEGTSKALNLFPGGGRWSRQSVLGNLSPDGKWLVWVDGGGDPQVVIAATLDSAHMVQWPNEDSKHSISLSPPVWLRDSKHFIDVMAPGQVGHLYSPGPLDAVVHNVTKRQDARVLVLPGTNNLSTIVATAEDRFILADNLPFAGPPPATLLECDFHSGRPAIHRLSTAGLKAAGWYNVALSPRGDRLAWVLSVTDPLPGPPVFKRFLATLGLRPRSSVGIWLTDVGKKSSRCIGRVPLETAAGQQRVPDVLRWLPDGRRLSFVYGDALYTIPVD